MIEKVTLKHLKVVITMMDKAAYQLTFQAGTLREITGRETAEIQTVISWRFSFGISKRRAKLQR